jgi:hypothetical protein
MKQIAAVITLAVLLPVVPAMAQVPGSDEAMACEAIMCLSTSEQPAECAPSVKKYFSISAKKLKDALKARKKFLSLCPKVSQDDINKVIAGHPPEPNEPELPKPGKPGQPATQLQ